MVESGKEQKRILGVVHDLGTKEFLRDLLDYDYTYRDVDSGEQALTLLRSSEFDLIMVDVQPDEGQQLDLIVRLREFSPDTATIVISSSQTIGINTDTLRLGAFDYIQKPFDLVLLETMIQRALTHTELVRDKRRYEDHLENLVEQRVEELYKAKVAEEFTKQEATSVVVSFDFPEEVRVPCEQYLLYFAQFLKDLGVEANTALTHEAGQVLFSITPADKQQALGRIRTALDFYLQLPSKPVSDATNESIEIQKLESNILRLRSELKLAAAEVQAKNATIQAHELTINVQQSLLSGEIIFDSLRNEPPKFGEETIGGIFAIKKYEGKGFEVDLPEIFRWLKRMLSTKD